MSKKEALQILLKSPFFFKLSISERKELVKEFLARTVTEKEGFVLGYD